MSSPSFPCCNLNGHVIVKGNLDRKKIANKLHFVEIRNFIKGSTEAGFRGCSGVNLHEPYYRTMPWEFSWKMSKSFQKAFLQNTYEQQPLKVIRENILQNSCSEIIKLIKIIMLLLHAF